MTGEVADLGHSRPVPTENGLAAERQTHLGRLGVRHATRWYAPAPLVGGRERAPPRASAYRGTTAMASMPIKKSAGIISGTMTTVLAGGLGRLPHQRMPASKPA